MLLPFVRVVIAVLLMLTSLAALFDVARIHMIVLSFLSAGLLVSLSFFESEFKKARASSSGASTASTSSGKAGDKTD